MKLKKKNINADLSFTLDDRINICNKVNSAVSNYGKAVAAVRTAWKHEDSNQDINLERLKDAQEEMYAKRKQLIDKCPAVKNFLHQLSNTPNREKVEIISFLINLAENPMFNIDHEIGSLMQQANESINEDMQQI